MARGLTMSSCAVCPDDTQMPNCRKPGYLPMVCRPLDYNPLPMAP